MKTAAILCVASMTLAVPAVAADSAVAAAARARETMRDYAQCLITASGPRASRINAFLTVSPRSPEAAAAAKGIVDPDCLRGRDQDTIVGRLQMKAQLIRGAIFRARFLRDFRGKPTPAFSPYDARARWHLPVGDPYAPWQAIGECTVRANPADARRAIEAKASSDVEDAAYSSLQPHLQACIPVNGTYRFSRTVLEGLFSEALYNLSAGASAPLPTMDTK